MIHDTVLSADLKVQLTFVGCYEVLTEVAT